MTTGWTVNPQYLKTNIEHWPVNSKEYPRISGCFTNAKKTKEKENDQVMFMACSIIDAAQDTNNNDHRVL